MVSHHGELECSEFLEKERNLIVPKNTYFGSESGLLPGNIFCHVRLFLTPPFLSPRERKDFAYFFKQNVFLVKRLAETDGM